MEKEEKILPIKDLTLVATLETLGFQADEVDYQIEGDKGRPIAYFHFKETETLEDAIKKFWAQKLAVEPRKFMLNLHGIKARIDGTYKNPRSKYVTQG
jgi:hypothetical protein